MTAVAAYLEVSAFASLETTVDTCPERMYVADAEASGPLRIEASVDFYPGMWMEMAARMEAVVDAP